MNGRKMKKLEENLSKLLSNDVSTIDIILGAVGLHEKNLGMGISVHDGSIIFDVNKAMNHEAEMAKYKAKLAKIKETK